MQTPDDDKTAEQPNLKDEAWAAPAAHPPAQDTKIARRLKVIAIVLAILGAVAVLFYVLSGSN